MIYETTRRAKCKDCQYLKYWHKGLHKLHRCTKKDQRRTLKDSICDDYLFSETGIPEPLK